MRDFFKHIFFYKCPEEESGNQLEVFRILIALYSLIGLALMMVDYGALLHPQGIINWEVSNANTFFFELHPEPIAQFFRISQSTLLNILITCYATSLLLLLFGLCTRIASFISFISFCFIGNIISQFSYGADIYQHVSLFMLCFFPVGFDLSISRKFEKDSTKKIRPICVRALQTYLSITYISAGWEKMFYENWWNGKYMFMVSSHPMLSSLAGITSDFSIYYFKVIGWLILLAEGFYFIAMRIPILRSIWLIIMLFLHLYIILFLSMPMFGLIMIILNICCWYPDFASDIKNLTFKYVSTK